MTTTEKTRKNIVIVGENTFSTDLNFDLDSRLPSWSDFLREHHVTLYAFGGVAQTIRDYRDMGRPCYQKCKQIFLPPWDFSKVVAADFYFVDDADVRLPFVFHAGNPFEILHQFPPKTSYLVTNSDDLRQAAFDMDCKAVYPAYLEKLIRGES